MTPPSISTAETSRLALLVIVPASVAIGLATSAALTRGFALPVAALAIGFLLLTLCARWPSIYLAIVFAYSLLGSAGPWLDFGLTLQGFSIYPLDMITMFGIALLVVQWIRGSLQLPPRTILLPLLTFVSVGVLWAIAGLATGNVMRNVFRDLAPVLGYLIVLVSYNAISNWDVFRRWIYILMALGLFTSIYALLMRALGIETQYGFEGSAVSETAVGIANRAYGFAGATNFYVCAFFLSISWLVILPRTRFADNWNLIVVALLTLAQMLLLLGRGLILGIVSGLASVWFSTQSTARLRLISIAAAVLFFFLVTAPLFQLPYAEEIISRYGSIIIPGLAGSSAALNVQARNDELGQVWAALDTGGRLIGRGLGTRLPVVLELGSRHIVDVYHNSIADAVLKIGIFGLGIYFWFVSALLVYMTRMGRTQDLTITLSWATGLAATFIALNVWGWGAIGMPLRSTLTPCLILGMALAGYRVQPDSTLASEHQDNLT